MLSLSLGCFIPLLRHRPFITTAAVTLISNGSNQVRGAHGSSSGSSFSSSEPPEYGSGRRRNTFVWVKVPIDDQKKTMTSIVVEEGDSIDIIRKAIKKKRSNAFASIDASDLELFESEQDIEQEKPPLDARMEWNSTVTWGTENTPLIVQVPVKRIYESPWSYSNEYPEQLKRGRDYVESIMKDYEDIPNSNGMKVLRNAIVLETGKSIDVVIRNITEDFWQTAIETTNRYRCKVGVVGSPGIGKATTTCIVIRLLLQQQKTFVYHVRTLDKDGFMYLFTPTSEGSADVKVIREKDFDLYDETIHQPSTYYIIDAGETKDDCSPPANFKCKVIIVASPDEGHWGGSYFERARGPYGTFLLYTGWKLSELLYSRAYFRSNLTDEEIKCRYEKVGGIPRHIFANDEDFADILQSQETAVHGLTDHQVKLLALGYVYVNSQPHNSIRHELTIFECSDPNFKDYTATVSSRRVTRLLVERHQTALWNWILNEGDARGIPGWRVFEYSCQNLMLQNTKFFDCKHHNGTELQAMTSNVSVPSLDVGGCIDIRGTTESLIVAAKRKENIVFYSLEPKYPLIDFVYRKASKLYAFQVTIGADHNCNIEYLKAAIEETGSEYDLLLHYLTYKTNYDKFKLKPVNPFADNPELVRSTCSKDWTIRVIQVPSPNDDHAGPSTTMTSHDALKAK